MNTKIVVALFSLIVSGNSPFGHASECTGQPKIELPENLVNSWQVNSSVRIDTREWAGKKILPWKICVVARFTLLQNRWQFTESLSGGWHKDRISSEFKELCSRASVNEGVISAVIQEDGFTLSRHFWDETYFAISDSSVRLYYNGGIIESDVFEGVERTVSSKIYDLKLNSEFQLVKTPPKP